MGLSRDNGRCLHARCPVPRSLTDPLSGLAVFERGWLSSNNVLVHAAPGEAGALLVDTSHVNHAAQTVALVRHELAGRPLAGIVNTHLHSDHCGGNALLQRTFGVPLALPPGLADAVSAWDEDRLSYRLTGQRMDAFSHQSLLLPGQPVLAGGRAWEPVAAGGHDPHLMMLFDRAGGVLLSADVLWENGFGLVFPELVGEPGFDAVEAALEQVARLPVRLVVPGHGRPFADVGAALDRSRQRLAGMRADPARHARHGLKVLIKYHLMEEREQPLDALLDWADATPLLQAVWQRFAPAGLRSARDWVGVALQELVDAGALKRDGERVLDA
jgi:glyoxylase-like metal-dependent hydrolase (beta-lactamase superfamily II)